MTFYSRMQITSNRLLTSKGQAVTLTKVTTGTYNTGMGTVTNTTSTQNGIGALLDYSIQQSGIFNAPGSLVKVGDKQLLLSPLNTSGGSLTAPAPGDTATIGGITYTITQVKTMSPAGTPVLYDVNLRA